MLHKLSMAAPTMDGVPGLIDSKTVEELRASRQGFEGYPVLYCLQHPTFILSGRHRLEAGWKERQAVDVQSFAQMWGVSHEIAHQVLRDRLNVQRAVSKDERAESVGTVAEALLASGAKTGEIVAELRKLFPAFSESYLRQLLPAKFKDEAKSEAGRAGGLAKAAAPSVATGNEIPSATVGVKGQAADNRHSIDVPLGQCMITYPCAVCRGPMYLDPSDPEDRRIILKLLEKGGIRSWLHSRCRDKVQVDA